MPQLNLPEKPKFVETITAIQKTAAGISGTFFMVALITLIPFIENRIFGSANKAELALIRLRCAEIALFLAAIVGVPQMLKMAGWIVKFYEFYNKFKKDNPDSDL